ncbi:MAG: hypothetical protein RLZZ393_416 [Pseudomonadota bacterium]|jgi:putative transcriptional regulator
MDNSLTGQLLVAMPAMDDPTFAQTVTLVCEHGEKGALGIIVNKPLSMKFGEVLSQMHLTPADPALATRPVLRGGPLHPDRGFVLHRPGGTWDSTHRISDPVQVTTSKDVLTAIARGDGPDDAFIALGYAGWEAGQLEQEIKDNAWLTLPFDAAIAFDLPPEERWLAAWGRLGVDVARLSQFAGHA